MDHSHHEHAHHDHNQHMMIMNSTITPLSNIVKDEHHDHHNHANLSIGSSDGHTGMDHMMMMFFHFGYNEVILFKEWKIESVLGLVGSMLAIFIMAIIYEGLKYYREHLFWKTYNLLEYRPVAVPNPESSNANRDTNVHSVHFVGEVLHKQPPSMFSLMHFYQTLLHVIQVTLSFLLMLIFMTYNVWLCLAVVLGAGVGYYLFCWKKSVMVDVTEHCH